MKIDAESIVKETIDIFEKSGAADIYRSCKYLIEDEDYKSIHPSFLTPLDIKIDPEKDIIQTENRIHVIRGGIAKGQLMGGNLTLITSMLGTPYLPPWKGKILFLEDTGVEYNHEFDRLMQQLEAAGVLKQISGFVFGQCTDCTTQYLKNIRSPSIDEILTRYIAPLNIPAWSGAMIGHMPEIFTLPEGTLVQIDADKGSITMLEPAVS